jgi:hypothetical protein
MEVDVPHRPGKLYKLRTQLKRPKRVQKEAGSKAVV